MDQVETMLNERLRLTGLAEYERLSELGVFEGEVIRPVAFPQIELPLRSFLTRK